MKILKIIGIVAGLHVVALLMIFANPGCSSTSKANPAASDSSVKAAPEAGAITSAPAAITYSPEASSSTVVFSPTRPGTPEAASLASQPVSDVVPATTYTVVHGDSLSLVAKRNHLTSSELATANNLKPGTALHVGQKLIIPTKQAGSAPASAQAVNAGQAASEPEGTKHTVKPGETLGAIARKYGVRMGDLAAANNISDPKKIQPGQELIIPARSGAHGKNSTKSKAAPSASQSAPAPEVKPVIATPSADQDLDTGLKPAAAGEVPVVKVDDSDNNNPPKVP